MRVVNLRKFYRIAALTIALLIVHYLNERNSLTASDLHAYQDPWETADFDAMTPAQIIQYVRWGNDDACLLYQGKLKAILAPQTIMRINLLFINFLFSSFHDHYYLGDLNYSKSLEAMWPKENNLAKTDRNL